MAWGTVELEPEVERWLEGLSTSLFARAAFYVDLLADQGSLLGEPYISGDFQGKIMTKQLDGKLRELRFYLEREAVRISYWIAPDRRIILLRVFRKSRMRDVREVERARRALARCIDEAHSAEEEVG
ncbi:type II toxin-antitoxin system RelE/ParE family toxin [Phytohabitans kaempferiae]|uniref:Type II toxin-antitoxin system RelE/ParE family toxin n=1 Tax=Phytohabitans kaempferiae TaxID=1620943 RepID=A0ABV6M9M7_9ACTN